MPTIRLETRIAAPIHVCFDLARDVAAHLETSSFTAERVVGGKTLQLSRTRPSNVAVYVS